MARYIDADALMKELSTMYKEPTSTEDYMTIGYDKAVADVVVTIHRQPTADVRENVHAHWLKEDHFGGIFKCSNCGKYVDFRGLKGTQDHTNFCPYCGARMET